MPTSDLRHRRIVHTPCTHGIVRGAIDLAAGAELVTVCAVSLSPTGDYDVVTPIDRGALWVPEIEPQGAGGVVGIEFEMSAAMEGASTRSTLAQWAVGDPTACGFIVQVSGRMCERIELRARALGVGVRIHYAVAVDLSGAASEVQRGPGVTVVP